MSYQKRWSIGWPLAAAVAAGLWLASPVHADDSDGPCTGFVVPPDTKVFSEPSEAAKPVVRGRGWLIALANPGFGAAPLGRVQIELSKRVDVMAACYGRDFTVEKGFLRIWLEPERLERIKGWVRLAELRTFEFQRPEWWISQDTGVNLTRVREGAARAIEKGPTTKAQADVLSTSEAFAAAPDSVWFAALEGILKAGWKIDKQDRSGGVITAKDRRLQVSEATTCTYMTGETEMFGLSVLVAPAAAGTKVSAVVSFEDEDLTERKCVSSGAVEQKVLTAIRAAAGR